MLLQRDVEPGLFFFSSRMRHTRFSRDWSSDVCSSDLPEYAEDASDAARAAADEGRIKRFREDTREKRIEIARELEHTTRRKVAWGVDCGETRTIFTSLSAPVMT